MRESLKDFFEGVSIKKALFIIIWTIGILGWVYFYQEFRIIRCEANWAYSESVKIHNQEDDGRVVGELRSGTPATQQVSPEAASEDRIAEALPSDSIEKIIYEVAKEKNFKDPELLVRIARAESSLNPCVKNPSSSAIGIFQILDMHGLTKEERCNPRIATDWAISHFNGGAPWYSSRSKWE